MRPEQILAEIKAVLEKNTDWKVYLAYDAAPIAGLVLQRKLRRTGLTGTFTAAGIWETKKEGTV